MGGIVWVGEQWWENNGGKNAAEWAANRVRVIGMRLVALIGCVGLIAKGVGVVLCGELTLPYAPSFLTWLLWCVWCRLLLGVWEWLLCTCWGRLPLTRSTLSASPRKDLLPTPVPSTRAKARVPTAQTTSRSPSGKFPPTSNRLMTTADVPHTKSSSSSSSSIIQAITDNHPPTSHLHHLHHLHHSYTSITPTCTPSPINA